MTRLAGLVVLLCVPACAGTVPQPSVVATPAVCTLPEVSWRSASSGYAIDASIDALTRLERVLRRVHEGDEAVASEFARAMAPLDPAVSTYAVRLANRLREAVCGQVTHTLSEGAYTDRY